MSTGTHWKTMMDNTYLGVCDFGVGEYKNLKIKRVTEEHIPPRNDKRPVIQFEGNVKPFVCNATNGKMIQHLLGTPIIEKWAGRTITLFADMTVRSPGQRRTDPPDGGVRVFNQLPKETKPQPPKKLICSKCGKEVTATEIQGKQYAADKIYKSTKGLCYDCYVAQQKGKEDFTEVKPENAE